MGERRRRVVPESGVLPERRGGKQSVALPILRDVAEALPAAGSRRPRGDVLRPEDYGPPDQGPEPHQPFHELPLPVSFEPSDAQDLAPPDLEGDVVHNPVTGQVLHSDPPDGELDRPGGGAVNRS